MRVRRAEPSDADGWLRMRCVFWPGDDAGHRREIARYFAGEAVGVDAAFVAEDHAGLMGLAELTIRPFAEGCVTDRVAYLEGWFVDERARRSGVGRELVRAAERWAREEGCSELASDSEVDNAVSRAAHAALGFEDVGLIRCFHKEL